MLMRIGTSLLGAMIALLLSGPAAAQNWPDLYDPLQMLRLNLDMAPADWVTIQDDLTFSIEVPAMFWKDGEVPILVAVRRKSATAIQNGTTFKQVSLKIDINELVPGQSWHGVKKLSIENGDDSDVLSEGISWYLHRLASGPEGYGHMAGLAAWVTVAINGTPTGVYVNVEQPNKSFLQNRGVFVAGQTWLYKVSDQNSPILKVGVPDSPTQVLLCYQPFGSTCPIPDPLTLVNDMSLLVNMQSLYTLGGVNQFTGGGDAIFSKGKNFYYQDTSFGLLRRYYPWDLDANMGGGAVNDDIYSSGGGQTKPYMALILDNPEFRAQYSQVMNDLICGPMNLADVLAFMDAAELLITTDLLADLNSQMPGGGVSGRFSALRNWFIDRYPIVEAQIDGFVECATGPAADLNGDGIVDTADLGILILQFGTAGPEADINGDGIVDTADLGILILQFGTS